MHTLPVVQEAWYFFGVSSTEILFFSFYFATPISYIPFSFSEPGLGLIPISALNGKEDNIPEEKGLSSLTV